MKSLLRPLALAGTLALVLLAGCASPAQKRENILVSCGFRTKPATTVKQIATLDGLATDKITPISHRGHILFVFPDRTKNLLYVGSAKEYAAYKKIRVEEKLATKEETDTFDREAKYQDLDGWKGLSDGWYNF